MVITIRHNEIIPKSTPSLGFIDIRIRDILKSPSACIEEKWYDLKPHHRGKGRILLTLSVRKYDPLTGKPLEYDNKKDVEDAERQLEVNREVVVAFRGLALKIKRERSKKLLKRKSGEGLEGGESEIEVVASGDDSISSSLHLDSGSEEKPVV